jgi:hypothetical protein
MVLENRPGLRRGPAGITNHSVETPPHLCESIDLSKLRLRSTNDHDFGTKINDVPIFSFLFLPSRNTRSNVLDTTVDHLIQIPRPYSTEQILQDVGLYLCISMEIPQENTSRPI